MNCIRLSLVLIIVSSFALGGPIRRQVTFCSDKPAITRPAGIGSPFLLSPSHQVPFDYKVVLSRMNAPADSHALKPWVVPNNIDAAARAAYPPKYCYVVTADIEANGSVRFHGVVRPGFNF